MCLRQRTSRMDEEEPLHNNNLKLIASLFESRYKFERLAILYVHDKEVARDIMMDSFRYLMEHIDSIDTGGNVEGYMFRVVKNKCLDWLQRERIRQTAENALQRDAEFEIEMRIATLRAFDPDWLYDQELRSRIYEAIDRLPDKTRRIFLMSRHDNMSYQEISNELDISVKTVEFHISKALASLRNDLGDNLMIYALILLSIN